MAVRGISHRPSPPDWNYPVSGNTAFICNYNNQSSAKKLAGKLGCKVYCFPFDGDAFTCYRNQNRFILSCIIFRKGKKEIFKFQKKTTLKHYSIGICGCGHGCGVTHLSIALSNYCASKLRCSTACLELNQSQDFESLSRFTSKDTPFSKKKALIICLPFMMLIITLRFQLGKFRKF